MSTPDDAVLAYWHEHREQLRQSENQRAVLTNYVLVITAAISGFVVQQHFAVRTLPLSFLIIIIGLYGAVSAAKYHERANYHLSQARALTRVLIDTGTLADHGVAGHFPAAVENALIAVLPASSCGTAVPALPPAIAVPAAA